MRPRYLLFEKIPLWVINLISIISGSVTILTAIVGILVFFSQKDDDTPLDINRLQFLIIVSLLFLVVALVEQAWVNYKRSYDRIQCVAQSFHILSHRFRDEMFQMLRDHENGQLSDPLLNKHLLDFLERSLNALCNVMSNFTEEDICACIQMIEYPNDGQIDDGKVFVFCRSENSNERRKNQDKGQRKRTLKEDPILFQMIGPNAIPYFSCTDLKEYEKSHTNDKAFIEDFRNSSISSYNGIFIVPIRIDNAIRSSGEKDSPFHVVGFLCLDTTSTKVFLSKYENDYAQIMKTFADIFYVAIGIYNDFKVSVKSSSGLRERNA